MIDLLKYNNDIISLNEDIKRHIDKLGLDKIEDVSKVKKKRRRGRRGGRRVREKMMRGKRVERHGLRVVEDLTLGFLNVRSLHNKVEEMLDLMSEYKLAGFFLAETWHDSDSECLSILRQKGILVLEKARSRSFESVKSHGRLGFFEKTKYKCNTD